MLDNARVIPVKHAEGVMFNQARTVAVGADGEHLHMEDLDHVASLVMPDNAGSAR